MGSWSVRRGSVCVPDGVRGKPGFINRPACAGADFQNWEHCQCRHHGAKNILKRHAQVPPSPNPNDSGMHFHARSGHKAQCAGRICSRRCRVREAGQNGQGGCGEASSLSDSHLSSHARLGTLCQCACTPVPQAARRQPGPPLPRAPHYGMLVT